METLFIVLIILASVLLVLLVLMQNPKGGGLSTDFGAAHQMGGVKQTNDFIEKATWSLAGIIGVLSIAMTLMYHQPANLPVEEAPATEMPASQGDEVQE
ncbi:preprotein translocase subunit SecG [Brumimicrobium sp.]|uniref:preprotein translocase subunit SecG n=1 Tax=Brumimicrobium sp. TaxID=2029867 RepID=UPI00260E2D5E|nr:preprotein translocase subunit SecG [uncultured Brumimicrobium sp.]